MRIFLFFITVLILTASYPAFSATPREGTVKVELEGADETVHVREAATGGYEFVVKESGIERALTPDAFAERVHREQATRPFTMRLFNITSWAGVIWVTIGLLGQVAFTGRMVVQWLVSEKRKRSVVPVAFWWMSLGGASMLIVYFIWRKDIVGILGQGFGWFIYVRNLWMIYGLSARKKASAT